MVTGNIKTQAYQNPVTAAGNTQKISTKTDFSQSIRQAAGSYAGTDNKSQNVSRNQEAAKDSSTAKNAVKSEMTDRDAKSSDVRSTKTETAAVDKNSEKEETNPEIADNGLKDGTYISAKGKKVMVIGGGDTSGVTSFFVFNNVPSISNANALY